jgi:hypothetical protein
MISRRFKQIQFLEERLAGEAKHLQEEAQLFRLARSAMPWKGNPAGRD